MVLGRVNRVKPWEIEQGGQGVGSSESQGKSNKIQPQLGKFREPGYVRTFRTFLKVGSD